MADLKMAILIWHAEEPRFILPSKIKEIAVKSVCYDSI